MALKNIPISKGGCLFYLDAFDAESATSPLAKRICAARPYGFGKRPWGFWQELAKNEECTVRILNVDPEEMLSGQRHQLRDEMYIVLDPGTVVRLGEATVHPSVGDFVFIPRNTWHRLSCGGSARIRVIEVAFGHYDQENDIERIDDKYGRPLTGTGIGSI